MGDNTDLLSMLDELLEAIDDVSDGKLPEIPATAICRARQASAIAHANAGRWIGWPNTLMSAPTAKAGG